MFCVRKNVSMFIVSLSISENYWRVSLGSSGVSLESILNAKNLWKNSIFLWFHGKIDSPENYVELTYKCFWAIWICAGLTNLTPNLGESFRNFTKNGGFRPKSLLVVLSKYFIIMRPKLCLVLPLLYFNKICITWLPKGKSYILARHILDVISGTLSQLM